ncbi:MAG: DUF5076 domain-containing protein [Brevundimonas sp.]|uniref:DUF5076 domain-containing protein n=1 Tax=Brevundimonas sp. TaxID=1871086 RepID=UPI00391D84C4
MSVEEFALPIPDEVLKAEARDRITELVRIWWADQGPQMILRPAVTDPKLFGMIMAELAWHYASGLEAKHGHKRDEALRSLLEGFAEANESMRKMGEPGAPENGQ